MELERHFAFRGIVPILEIYTLFLCCLTLSSVRPSLLLSFSHSPHAGDCIQVLAYTKHILYNLTDPFYISFCVSGVPLGTLPWATFLVLYFLLKTVLELFYSLNYTLSYICPSV